MFFIDHKLPLRVRLRSSSPLETKVIAPNTFISSNSTFSFVAYSIALFSLFLSILDLRIAAPRNAKISQQISKSAESVHSKPNRKIDSKPIKS